MRFLDRILQDHYRDLELKKYGIGEEWATVLLTPRFVTSRHVVALIFAIGADHPSLVVKVPRQPGDNESLRREAEVMMQLKSFGVGAGQGAPEVVGVLDVGAHTVLIETAVTGILLEPGQVAANVNLAVDAGSDFVAGLPCTKLPSQNADWYSRTISSPLRALASLLPADAEVAALVDRTHLVLEPLRSVQLPAVVEHGDLSYHNLFLQPDGRLQVVDWERSRMDGVPAHDLVFYLQYVGQSREQANSRGEQLKAFDNAFGPSGWAVEPLAKHLDMRKVDAGLLPQLVVATWARSAATLGYRLAGQDAGGRDSGHVLDAVTSDRDFWLWRHAVTGWTP